MYIEQYKFISQYNKLYKVENKTNQPTACRRREDCVRGAIKIKFISFSFFSFCSFLVVVCEFNRTYLVYNLYLYVRIKRVSALRPFVFSLYIIVYL